MVVSAEALATRAGVEILKAGGNAVDAAVATAYAEAVTNPCCGNIGGGGFLLIHRAGIPEDVFVNFRETAPHGATEDMYTRGGDASASSLSGYLAVAVPGTVAGLDLALSRYGRLSRARVMAPAIRLASEGFILSLEDAGIFAAGAARLARDPEAKRLFLHRDGTPLRAGERMVQSDLARTLRRIAKEGPPGFYHGEVAYRLVAAMAGRGGLITAQDLADYAATESAPIHCNYRGYEISSAPPPSSGGTAVCETLNVLAGYDLAASGFNSARTLRELAESLRYAFIDRNRFLGDPAFVDNPIDSLLGVAHTAEIRASIDAAAARSDALCAVCAAPPSAAEKPETTHLSVVDAEGNAVSLTYTVNGLFGAGVVAPGTGFLLNDEMDDFATRPGIPNLFGLVQSRINAIAPGKRPLSSMAPTIVTRDGHLVMVVGSSGGSRIISIVAQVISNVLDHGMGAQEAIDAPRVHFQGQPNKLFVESYALSADTRRVLEADGYSMAQQTPWGAAELILIGDPRSAKIESSGNDSSIGDATVAGRLYGAFDPRRPAGAALGY